MNKGMNQTGKGKLRFMLNLAAILSIYFFSGPGTYENAAIQACMEAWPDAAAASIRSLVTISSVVSVPVMLLVSPFAGKRIRYRTLMLSGAILALAGGLIPFFLRAQLEFHPGLPGCDGSGGWIFRRAQRPAVSVCTGRKKGQICGIWKCGGICDSQRSRCLCGSFSVRHDL